MSNRITRWYPFRDIVAMQNAMDRMFDDWRPFVNEGRMTQPGHALALDVHEDETQYIITTELPGMKAENINIKQEGEFLLIDAEMPETTTERENQRTLIKERRYGRFSRRLRLPQNVDFAKAEANYEDGVLTLNLPKAAAEQPKTIQVKSKANGGNFSQN